MGTESKKISELAAEGGREIERDREDLLYQC